MTGARGLRVALLAPCYWPEVRRGGERFSRELADGLIALGHRPRLITSHPGRPSSAVEDGLGVTRVWRPPQGRLQRRQHEDYLTHVPFSYAVLARGDDDVAQALYPTDALAAARWTERTGRPSILSYHGIPTRHYLALRRGRAELTLRAARGCSAVTANSGAARDEFRRTLGVEARVIYPGVDTSAFVPAPARAPVPTIFCGASLDQPWKRVPLLVAALRRVRRERPDARLVLVRPSDPALARRVAAEDGVELIEFQDDRAALARVYGEAWASVLPSTHEPFGLVLAEALACGTPVVGSDTGAVPEIVASDDVGRLFRAGDEPDLARAVLETLELAADPATAAACRARAEEFSTQRCAAAHEALYRELTDRI